MMNTKIKIIGLTLGMMLGWLITLSAQNPQLAMHYYNRGEYEKAQSIFTELVDKQPGNKVYFEKLMDCLTQLRKYDDALHQINQRIQRYPADPVNHFLEGNIYELKENPEKAKTAFEQAIGIAAKNPSSIASLAQQFQERGKYELALETFEASRKEGKVHPSFTLPMASLYYNLGEYNKMIDSYLDAVDFRPESVSFVLNYFQRYLPDDYLDDLEQKVLKRLQESSNESYNEILAWAYIQNNNYAMAYRQLRSIDKRKQENGYRLFRLGQNAIQADEYEGAIRIFKYVISDKGRNSPYYYPSQGAILKARKSLILERTDSNQVQQLENLTTEYLTLVDSLGYNRLTASLIKSIAEIQAFEIHDYEAAIQTLEKLIGITGISKDLLSTSKILLADIYLSTGDRWEATLLYSQVDKEHKEDETGQLARFRNAKLSYYMGDFEWAQKQFDILRRATSRLIANDAIDMNIFIIDNLGLDTTEQNLKAYAQADFLHFKNEDAKALKKLDSLAKALPEEHDLHDDIIYLEAEILRSNKKYDEAKQRYEAIVAEHPDGIWADNSLFAIAQLYLEKLDQPEKAMATFEKIFIDYDNSTFAVDARKKYRELKAILKVESTPEAPQNDTIPSPAPDQN